MFGVCRRCEGGIPSTVVLFGTCFVGSGLRGCTSDATGRRLDGCTRLRESTAFARCDSMLAAQLLSSARASQVRGSVTYLSEARGLGTRPIRRIDMGGTDNSVDSTVGSYSLRVRCHSNLSEQGEGCILCGFDSHLTTCPSGVW